jgi:hypothetical protein
LVPHFEAVRARLICLILLGCVTSGHFARADSGASGGFRFVYERAHGAEACPDERRVRGELERLLGRAPFGGEAHATLFCRIARHGSGLRAVITVLDAGGPGPERVLDSPRHDCADLAPAMELTLALAIDPSAHLAGEADPEELVADASATPEAAPAPAPPAEASAANVTESPPTSSVAAVTAAEDAPARTTLVLTASLVAEVGVAPGPGGGVAAGAGLQTDAWSFGLELGASLSSGEDTLGGRVAGRLVTLAFVPCWRRGDLALCGVARAGVLRGSGGGFDGARADAAPWAATGARLSWRVARPGGLALRALAEALVPLVGGRLLVGAEEAWRSPPVAGVFGLAVEFE